MVSNVTLLLAIHRTVAETLRISEKTISSPILTPNRRALLSGMFVSYVINVTSYRTTESFKLALMDSVTSGDFVALLKAKSGIMIESTYNLHFDDYSPTLRPTINPSSILSNQAGKEMMIVASE